MKRSLGVTAAAVVLLFGSGLFFAGALGSFITLRHSPPQTSPELARAAGANALSALVLGSVALAWGLATAVGAFRLRPWARISFLAVSVYSVLLGLLPLAGRVWLLTTPGPSPGTS